jgi:4-amino-4-deoxy-L-arabinose transferase-like glycosyltransferase
MLRKGERAWLALLVLSFVFGLAASWERWGNPLIDNGREMNMPLRIVNGERLYSDIRHIYGPLSPWLHAGLYRAFGPSLSVLYADGILSAILILALVYWLARRLMDPAGAAAATLTVMWLCVFRQSGVYILPYSYNLLHGTLFGLLSLAVLVIALASQRARVALFLLAGVLAGLSLLAKTEMGVAAVAAGVAAALLADTPSRPQRVMFLIAFLATSLGLTVGVYAMIAAQIGWATLIDDSWLLLYNIAPELRIYNNRVAGFDRPFKNIGRMLIAAAKLGIIAALVAASAQLIGGDAEARRRAWRVLGAALVVFIVMAVTSGLDWDKGPFLAMPFLLIGVIVAHGRTPWSSPTLTVYAVFALACVARMLLHVRSGGAYASFLLPMSVVIFVYLWMEPFARLFRSPRVQAAARATALVLLVLNGIITAGLTAHRYRVRNPAPIETTRGTMFTGRDLAQAWDEALAYIESHTRPDDAVAVMPEGTSLDFFSGRRNPLREEITTPGYLDAARESRAIEQLAQARAPLILITNRVTAEFGPAVFGRDYNVRLMQWIEGHYRPCAIFGPDKNPALQIGAEPFFIRAYCII